MRRHFGRWPENRLCSRVRSRFHCWDVASTLLSQLSRLFRKNSRSALRLLIYELYASEVIA